MLIHMFILQGRFFLSFQFLCCIQRNSSCLISEQLGRKDFSVEQLSVNFYVRYYVNIFIKNSCNNSISINQYILSFNLIAIYIKKKPQLLQAHNQDFFRAVEFFWNQGISINIHLQHKKEKPRREKSSGFFTWKLLKIAF